MARVQDAQTRTNATGAPTCSLTSLPAAGSSLIVMFAAWANVTHTETAVVDNQGNSYTQIGTTRTVSAVSDFVNLSMWQLTNVGSTSGTYTITGTSSGATPSDCNLAIAEYNGMVTTSLVDQQTGTTGTGATNATVTLGSTTTNAYDTVVGAVTYRGSTTTIAEDQTNLPGLVREIEDNLSGQSGAMAERFVGATGTHTANWTLGAARDYCAIVVAIKDANPRPYLRAVGTGVGAASGNITPTLPTHATDDILLLVIHSSDNVASTFPGGWAVVPSTGTSGEILEANNTAAMRATVAYKRATSASETNPLITHTAGAMICAKAYSFGGIIATGTPFSNTRLSPNAASATVAADGIVPAAAQDMAFFGIHYEDDPTTCSEPTGWHDAGTPYADASGNDGMVHLFFTLAPSTATLTPSTVVSGGTFANSVNVGTTWTMPKVAAAGAQDTPELYGMPYGESGQRQMMQLLAT